MDSPQLFSTYYGLDPTLLDNAGFLDPFLDVDLPLFIDPLLLEKSSNKRIATDGIDAFKGHFEQLVRLLIMCENEADAAWRAAEYHLSLREPAENGLGYGRRGRSGRSRPKEVRTKLLRTIREIIQLGSKDPEMLSLMGFLEEGVGSDTISDFTTRAMLDVLAQMTNEFCVANNIAVFENDSSETKLPLLLRNKGGNKPLVLVPKDIVRHLPVTDNWSDVWAATQHNQALREKVNRLLGGLIAPTVAQQKEAIRSAVLQSAAIFDDFLAAVRSSATAYDPNEDIFGFYKLRDLLAHRSLPVPHKTYDLRKGPEEVQQVVLDAVSAFKHHVENGNLWEALWAGNDPKRERASQLIFYAIADAYCRANNVDLSGEPNMGGGPVDFKFSDGFNARVVVEMKRSMGQVEHGYNRQLNFYKTAAQTDFGVFVVIDYGDGLEKISRIRKERDRQISLGNRASEIIVVDARKKLSPSKRP